MKAHAHFPLLLQTLNKQSNQDHEYTGDPMLPCLQVVLYKGTRQKTVFHQPKGLQKEIPVNTENPI